MVSAVIIAEKIEEKINENLKNRDQTDESILNPSGAYIFYMTVKNVLDSDVNECILIYDNSDGFLETLKLLIGNDKRLKTMKFQKGLNLRQNLLKGINKVTSNDCLCLMANQPLISSDTLKKLINKISNTDEDSNISFIERKRFKFLDSFEMPFVCKTTILKNYLYEKDIDLNAVFKKMTKNSTVLKVPPISKYELITIRNCKDFKNFLNFKRGIAYKSLQSSFISNLFSWNKLSKNFEIYFAIYVSFIGIILIFMFIFPSNFFFTNINNLGNMIGTIVQSESAIIAIVITLSLVAVQLTASSYTPRVITIFKNSLSLWILIISYLITMSYGLILLKLVVISSNNEVQLWIVLLMSIFSFFALIPFLLDMFDLMKPSQIIYRLGNEINDYQMLYSIENFDEDEIQPLIDIVHSSLMRYDYGTLRSGLKAIAKYNECIFTNTKTFEFEKRKISKCILEHLSRVCKLSINQNDDEATNLILITISYNVLHVRARKYNEELFDAIRLYGDIGELAIKNNLNLSLFTSLMFLQQISLTKSPKYIIDYIFQIYTKFERQTTDKDILNQISGARELFKRVNQDEV